MTDYAQRRVTMVDTQIRPSDVTKFPIIDAFLSVAREDFVPRAAREAAYMGDNIDIGGRRVILEPRTLAKMLDAVHVQPDELVLDIGFGFGYSSAVLSRLAEAVVAVDDISDRFEEVNAALSNHGADNVATIEGELHAGAPKHGPYDVIMIQGAVEQLPDALLAQVKDGGRIVCIFQEGRLGVCRVGYRIDGKMAWRFAFNAGAPVLPGFEADKVFAL